MKRIPARYVDYFTEARTPSGHPAWRCSLCQLLITQNTVGAQSHLAKHVRELRADRPSKPAAPELQKLLNYPAPLPRRRR